MAEFKIEKNVKKCAQIEARNLREEVERLKEKLKEVNVRPKTKQTNF